MHGLVNRAVQCFVQDSYGAARWQEIVQQAQLGAERFEAMLKGDIARTDAVIDSAAAILGRPRAAMLEDLGTYLVSHPNTEALRRLLRFGGVTFLDFLNSLEDLPGRARLAVPDLTLPALDLASDGPDRFILRCLSELDGAGHVATGLLRAIADDYGALVLLEHRGSDAGGERIAIHLLENRFRAARPFRLSVAAG